MIGIGTHIRRRFGAPKFTFTFTCTTTGAETLTLTRLDLAAGKSCVINWGDGTSNTYTSADNGSTKTKAYAGAGTYTVKISNPKEFTVFDLRDNKALLNSNQFKMCGANLVLLRINKSSGIGSIFNSDDVKHLNISNTFELSYTVAGTYIFNTNHCTSMTPTAIFFIVFTQTGTYTYNSADLINVKPTTSNELSLNNPTTTITRLHYAGQTNIATFRRWLALDATKVTDILLGLYDAFPSKTNAAGTINVAGTGAMANASPTGTLQAHPEAPTCTSDPTGKEAAHELVNDGCGRSLLHWTSVTIN